MPKRNVPWIDRPLIYHRIYDLSRRPVGQRPFLRQAEALLFHPVVGAQKPQKGRRRASWPPHAERIAMRSVC